MGARNEGCIDQIGCHSEQSCEGGAIVSSLQIVRLRLMRPPNRYVLGSYCVPGAMPGVRGQK